MVCCGGGAVVSETWIMLVRHPETEANINGHYVGRGDSPYTERGRAQVESLTVADRRVRARRRSGRARCAARYTVGERAAELADVPLRVDDRLNELDFGIAEGLSFDEATEQGIAFEFANVDGPGRAHGGVAARHLGPQRLGGGGDRRGRRRDVSRS